MTAAANSATGGQPQKNSPPQADAPNLVFPATLRLSRRGIVIDGREVPLTAGMSVATEIKTGQRRLIDYLLSPLQ